MKNVLLLLPGAFSGHGGIEMFDRQLVRAFLELGLEQGFETSALVLNDAPADVDARYLPGGASALRGFRGRKLPFVLAAIARGASTQPDLVVWGHLNFAPLAPWMRRISPRSRHWFVAHGIEAWKPLPSRSRAGLALAERVLAVSDYTRNELARNSGVPFARIELLPNSLDEVFQSQYGVRRESPSLPGAGRPTILTVARLDASERYKGIDSVIRALPSVLEKVPDLLYEVVGDGNDRGRLEALAREQGVADRVRFRGRVSSPELAAAYRGCSLYVMPSSHEGFGIVFLEAALFGKASIGGKDGGTPEVIEDGVTGVLLERENIDVLAATLVRMMINEDLRREMGLAARRRMLRHFTYPAFRSALANHLTSFCSTVSEGR